MTDTTKRVRPSPTFSQLEVAAMHIHDAHCDGDPCYDANTELHRFPPTDDDFHRADRLLAGLAQAQAMAAGLNTAGGAQ